MKQQYEPVIIFSVFQGKNSADNNYTEHQDVQSVLQVKGIKYKEVDGRFNKIYEKALVVNAENETFITEVCKINNQECYLYLDQDRNAYLVNPSTKERNLAGVFKAVESNYEGDYTLDTTTNIKYAII